MQFTINEVVTKDLDEIQRLINSEEDLQQNEEKYSREYLEQLILDPQAIFFKATKSGKIIGVVFGEFDAEQDWADMLSLIVEETQRNRGVESRLLDEFENKLVDEKISNYNVFSSPENLSFYEDKGLKQRKHYISLEKKL